jgi:ankyrin repeat protein
MLLFEQIKELVKMGADVSTHNNFVLSHATANGRLEIVKYLVEEHDAKLNVGDDSVPLRLASNYGYLEIVKYLVEKGADIHALTDEALRHAAVHGYLEIVKYLIENGADIHASNDYALRYAAFYGHLETVKYLLEKGADIHAEDDYALRHSSGRVKMYLQSIIDKEKKQ